jgi:hypothetical protein
LLVPREFDDDSPRSRLFGLSDFTEVDLPSRAIANPAEAAAAPKPVSGKIAQISKNLISPRIGPGDRKHRLIGKQRD